MNATIKTSGAPVQGAGPDEKSLIIQLWRRAHELTENERGQLCDLIRARFIRVARARYPGGFTPQDREDLASEFILQKILTNPVEATSRAPENDAHLNSFVRNFCMDAFRKRRTVQSNEVCCDDLDSLGDEGGSDGAAVEFPEGSSDGATAEFAESGLMEDDPNLALRAMKFVNDLPGRIASPRATDTGVSLFHLAHGLQTFAGDETLPRKMDYVRVYGVGWNKDLAVRIGADGALIKAFLDSGNKKFLQTPVAELADERCGVGNSRQDSAGARGNCGGFAASQGSRPPDQARTCNPGSGRQNRMGTAFGTRQPTSSSVLQA